MTGFLEPFAGTATLIATNAAVATTPLQVWQPSALQKVLIAVAGLIVIVVGIRLLSGANKAQYHDTARVGFNTIIGLVIVGLGISSVAYATFSEKVMQLFGFNV